MSDDLVRLRAALQAAQDVSAHLTDLLDAAVRVVDAMGDEPLPGLRVVHSGYERRQDWDEGRAEDQREREKDRG